MQVRVSAVLVEEMLLKIKVPIRFVSWSGIKDDRVKNVKSQKQADSDRLKSLKTVH